MKLKKNPALKWKVYCVIDNKVFAHKDPQKMAKDLFKAKVDVIQLRYKNYPSYKLVGIAKKIKKIAQKYRKTLLINDRIDVALASNASGVHLGDGDMSARLARILLNKNPIVGKSIHSKKEAKHTKVENLDYLSTGPIFATPVKKNLKSKGLKFIKKMKKYTDLPVLAIGGINKKNVKKVLSAGADGICVVRASQNAAELAKEVKK